MHTHFTWKRADTKDTCVNVMDTMKRETQPHNSQVPADQTKMPWSGVPPLVTMVLSQMYIRGFQKRYYLII